MDELNVARGGEVVGPEGVEERLEAGGRDTERGEEVVEGGGDGRLCRVGGMIVKRSCESRKSKRRWPAKGLGEMRNLVRTAKRTICC